MSARKGDWMQLASGRAFWPLDPRVDEVFIDDIAAALSKLCRYGGHCKRFYSVAEHCVLMANSVPPSIALSTLMHDASEAYLSDVIRPIKRHIPQYGEIETELEKVIAQRFSLPWPLPESVKQADNGILWAEMEQNMAPPPQPWTTWLTDAPLRVTLRFWSPEKAEAEFLAAFTRFGGK